eukprot:Plantae.Rhodophyta-Purpureofilum_apyrenoidigerum.ctg13518.p1 GENE.Plantae.Rhodophyta-Purpureofilum_apyrenoidigerum.ctg13518~~Plantae.Rhodophyta-Purpureofilum_apyrenoidigerum.ctg13518.p1  ORF type:complete len:637 (-),score=111.81 Plantae.Rhodophyta-Purpureofilum_apyrenoidigerum.ctg13518:225-2135(-)
MNGHERTSEVAFVEVEQSNKPRPELYERKDSLKFDVHSFDLRNLTLTFKDAQFSVDERGILLHPISGCFRGGQMVAFMGPSGSGKTTLLTMIAQKKTTKYEGAFLLNGREVDERLFPRFTGYVPQEEHLNGDMTVRECLYFYVMLKNQKMTPEQGERRVQKLLTQLELESCADSCIGTETRRGISGGQKRRVNIAKGFANTPPIIFLDEPTSGLSSTDSMTVVQCLRNFADETNTLVICVIHQPRHSIFQLFDVLVLLNSSGQCVYQGPVDEVVDYFTKMGKPIPPFENPPDFMLDVVTTHRNSLIGDEEAPKVDTAQKFAEEYELNVKPLVEEQIDKVPKGPTLEQVLHTTERKCYDRDSFNRSLIFQFKLLLHFQFLLRARNWREILRRVIMYVIIGTLFGLVFFRTSTSQTLAFNRVLSMWVIIGFAAIFTMESLPKLMAERIIYKYDRMDGVYGTLPYLGALSAVLFVESSVLTVIMGTIAYWMIGFSSRAGDFFFFLLLLLAVYWVTEGVMLLLASACADAAQANGLTVAVVGVLLVFSGLVVNVGASPPWLSWLCWLSPYWYAFQSILVTLFREFQFSETDRYENANDIYDYYGVNPKLVWVNFVIIILWALFYRVIVVALLRFAHNPKV